MAFVDGRIDNDEKIASSSYFILQYKSHILLDYDQNGQNRYLIHDQGG